jgi:hypothetical protein
MIIAKGTGINVHNVIQTQMNASFSLDGDSPSVFAYSWDIRCYTGGGDGPFGCYNASVYNAQSLTYGAHILNITMLSYIGPGNTLDGTYSDFIFDYAVISSPSANPSSTGNTGSSNQRSQYVLLTRCSSKSLTSYSPQVAAAIGGAVGGGILITILTVLYYCKRRYQRQRRLAEVDPEPTESSFQPTTFVTNPPLNRDALHDWSPTNLLPEDTDLQNSHISPPRVLPKSDILSATAKVPASSVATAGTSQYALLNKPQSAHEIISSSSVVPTGVSPLTGTHFTEEQSELVRDAPISLLSGDVNSHPNDISPPPNSPKYSISSATAHAPASSSQYSSSSQPSQPSEAEAVVHAFSAMSRTGTSYLMGSRLTDEQSELVQGLLRHNVPLPAVVVAIEGMLRRDGSLGGGEGSGSQNTQRDGDQEGDNPPGYDFV